MSQKLDNLFSSINIGKLKLGNRAVMPAMGTGFGNADGRVSYRLVSYLARRAQGGTGLIITEVCAVDPRGKAFPNQLCAHDDSFIDGLEKIPAAIHKFGARVALQLHHAGRETLQAIIGAMPEAPSAIPSVILKQPCEAMSKDRIAAIVEAFAQAALRAKKAGFDAVEIHGAHGYLIGQFLSPTSNVRDDEYGGSEENRARFALEIVKAVRNSTGPDFPIIFRFSTEELIEGGYDLEFAKRLAPKLVEAGANALHASVGVYSTPGNLSIAGYDTEPGFNLFRARAIKEVVNVPVIAIGRINDPQVADAAIGRGDADLIAFGRQHLADPDFIRKAKDGDCDRIRFCLACNQGCIERLSYELSPITCTINPECGIEYQGAAVRAEKPLKIWVAGAGPAGLAATLAACGRGHHVEIFERDGMPGGQLVPAGKPPHKQSYMEWVYWIIKEIARKEIGIRFCEEVTEELLRRHRPDKVIVATGANPITPAIPGIDSPNVFDARDTINGKIPLQSPAIIIGAGYVGMETADFLIANGVNVTLIDALPNSPVKKHLVHGYWLHKRLRDAGGKTIFGAEVTKIDSNALFYRKDGVEHKIEPAPTIIKALGARPETALVEALEKLNIPYRVIGDAKKPRRLLEAIAEGFEIGNNI